MLPYFVNLCQKNYLSFPDYYRLYIYSKELVCLQIIVFSAV